MFHGRDSSVAAWLQQLRHLYYTICSVGATALARKCDVIATILGVSIPAKQFARW